MSEVILNQLDDREEKVALAEALMRLIDNPDFDKVFNEKFINAFALTNVHNMWMFDDAGRRRFHEKTLARSHFSNFMTVTLEEGRDAAVSLATPDEEDENPSDGLDY